MPITAVVFDLFDTLVDLHMDRLPEVEVNGRTFRSSYGMLHETLREYEDLSWETFVGALAEIDRYRWRLANETGTEFPTLERFNQLCDDLGLPRGEIAEALTARHMGAVHETVEYLPHHVDVMDALAARGKTAVCSNFTHTPTALAVIDKAGLAGHFDAIVISHDVMVRKPRKEIFEHTLEVLGVEPAEVLHVGDNIAADVGGAGALGMRTAWVTRCVRNPASALSAYEGPAPTYTIADLAEVKTIVAEAD